MRQVLIVPRVRLQRRLAGIGQVVSAPVVLVVEAGLVAAVSLLASLRGMRRWHSRDMAQTAFLMPRFVRPTWTAIENQVEMVHARWEVYEQLFGVSAARFEVLKASADAACAVINQALLEHVQLTLAKLGGRGSKNLTVHTLAQVLKDAGESQLYRALQVPIGRFVAETADIELRRNKRLAHFDRAMHLAEVDGTVRFANASSVVNMASKM